MSSFVACEYFFLVFSDLLTLWRQSRGEREAQVTDDNL